MFSSRFLQALYQRKENRDKWEAKIKAMEEKNLNIQKQKKQYGTSERYQ